jgi:hypothetical protein
MLSDLTCGGSRNQFVYDGDITTDELEFMKEKPWDDTIYIPNRENVVVKVLLGGFGYLVARHHGEVVDLTRAVGRVNVSLMWSGKKDSLFISLGCQP